MRLIAPSRSMVAAALAAVLLVPAAAASAEPSSASSRIVTALPSAQQYFWKWSDGSQKTSRTFKKSTYHDQAGLPHLVVTAQPAKPSHVVYLQFKQKGKWIVENKVTTNSKGVATIDLNPYCSNDTWCDGTWSYRLKIGSLYQNLKLTYSEK